MRYQHLIIVSPTDIDELGHVNNVVYVRYVQEAATAHWNAITTEEMRYKSAWVVMRHEIDYINPAFERDELIATTWVGESAGVRSDRFVEIHQRETGKLIIKAKTTWCHLDSTTLRPKRIDESIILKLTQG